MAQMVSLTILGTPKSTFSTSQTYALPVGAFIATPVPANVSAPAGTDSVINVFPTGLNQPARVLYCAETVAQVVTAANAPLA
tara:strand:+ start:29 stop:274 length:246 start_codon:yes stop_codon:yes gene_type:complete